jgi:hypothetical protein
MNDRKHKSADAEDARRGANGSQRETSNSGGSVSQTQDGAEPDFATKVATIGVIGVGVALIEVSLIPGMLIGLAAALAPKYAPRLGEGLRPLVKSTVRGTIKLAHKTREVIAEAGEQVQDIMAEARLEDEQTAAAPKSAAAGTPTAQP